MRWVLVAVLSLVMWHPPVASAQAAEGTAPPAAPQVIGRKILPDGRVEVTYADGTTATKSLQKTSLEPPLPPGWLKDPDTEARFLAAMRAFYDYQASGFEHRRRVFDWQLLSSRLIFVTVLLLVALGMVFAAIQFQVGLRRRTVPNHGPVEPVTQIELAVTSVKVTSPVLGVVILRDLPRLLLSVSRVCLPHRRDSVAAT